MTSLRYSPRINRLIRQDAPEDLGQPTQVFLEAAIREGQPDEARKWLDYLLNEQAHVVGIYAVWNWYMVRYYLDRKPEAMFADLLRLSLAPWLGTTAGLVGHPVASVTADGTSGRLDVGAVSLHLNEGIERFELTIDSSDAQASRRAQWRARAETAMAAGDVEEFRRLLDHYLRTEGWLIHDIHADWSWALLSVCAREWGEEVLDEVLRVTEEPWVTRRYAAIADMSAEESLQLTIEGMRGHFTGPGRAGHIFVTEEADRYVMSFDACGSGGRMRRGDVLVGSGSRLDAPYCFLNAVEAHDWTWNRKNVCAYCGHCAMVNQILPIENLGHPMRMVEYPEDAQDPCRWIIYKDPATYPHEAFARVGKG